MYKPLTQFQKDVHMFLTGALMASPVVGAGLGMYLYSVGYLNTWAIVWSVVPFAVVLLAWLDTEVSWRKREAMFRRTVARIVGH